MSTVSIPTLPNLRSNLLLDVYSDPSLPCSYLSTTSRECHSALQLNFAWSSCMVLVSVKSHISLPNILLTQTDNFQGLSMALGAEWLQLTSQTIASPTSSGLLAVSALRPVMSQQIMSNQLSILLDLAHPTASMLLDVALINVDTWVCQSNLFFEVHI